MDVVINLLVSDILGSNSYSHCRLCLDRISEEQFARFHDSVSYSTTEDSLIVRNVLSKVFGTEICNVITGLDAICSDCLDKTIQTFNLMQQYERVTEKLHKLLGNLTSTIDNDIDVTNQNQVLHIMCNKDESMIIVQSKEKKPIIKAPFKCSSCKENFDDLQVFVEHNRDHGLFTCEKCMHTSKSEEDVLEHDTSSTYYKCRICSQHRCTEDSLKDHEVRTHDIHVCKQCGKSCKGLDKLLAHEQKHSVKNNCPKCGKTYMTKEFFEKHVARCLEDRVEPHPMRSRIVKTLFCPQCNKGYSTPSGLHVHMKFVHGNAKHHVCKECGRKFTARCYLKVHMVTHTKEKNFLCNLCDGRFVSKEALLYHNRRHTGEKPYSCDECGERFVNASARVEHIKFKHIGPTLSCEVCSRKFVTKIILRNHEKKHYDPSNKLYIGRADIPFNRGAAHESDT